MHLAQFNIAKCKAPLDDPLMKPFVDNLERINRLAEQSDGFIWRLQDESGDATDFSIYTDPNIIVNLSVWDSVDALKQFVYTTEHLQFLQQKSQWFEKLPLANLVLWWIPENHEPPLQEAKDRLTQLQHRGDRADAFSFRHVFERPGS